MSVDRALLEGSNLPMNRFLVAVAGEDVAVLMFGRRLTRAEALNLAAWLLVLGQIDAPTLGEAVRLVEES